ncbi:MAG: molybdopterin dehydrogenase [Dehalococcoidia bacterium]|nr:MAG: molybdopterin dehydrogenase [Dehalococcoidia bacterium]
MNKFTHVNAATIQDATAALAKGKTQVIAGGTDLITYMKGMISPNPPETLVNIKTIPNLSYIKEEGGLLKIGALTTLTTIANSSVVKTNYTVLAQAAQAAACPEIRNMGTIGGNICQRPRCIYFRNEFNDFNCLRKNPSGLCYALVGVNRYHSIFGALGGCVAVCPSDTASALVALNASIVTSKKTWKAADFFGIGATAFKGEQINQIDADEIVTEIQIPTPAAGTKSAYLKFAFRKAIDFPLVSAAVVVTQSAGTVSAASIVLGGVHNAPKVATAAQDAIKGKAIDATTAAAAGTAATTGTTVLAMNKYKVQIAQTLVKRALLAAK